MSASSRFAVATHILTLLAVRGDEPTSSDLIARSVQTNPVVIRRMLGLLARAGLVSAVSGRGGGAVLGPSAERITLLDIYRAVEDHDLMRLHDASETPCNIGRQIHSVLGSYCDQAEDAMARYLRGVTLAEIVQRIETEAPSRSSGR